jgi:hypothetical protein
MGPLKRLVENQEQKVTVALVDDRAEHEMLESSKPRPPGHDRLGRFDYLLRTPWRYPPLRWGSRFGRRFEPGLFYGALSEEALFAEAAYYRLLFLDGMETPFRDRVISQFTVFDALYRGETGLDRANPPFQKHEGVLTDRSQYGSCQALGTVLRDAGIDLIIYRSARAEGRERNIALFRPFALRSRKHRNPRHGICETRPERVWFRFRRRVIEFDRAQFLVDGNLPQPA